MFSAAVCLFYAWLGSEVVSSWTIVQHGGNDSLRPLALFLLRANSRVLIECSASNACLEPPVRNFGPIGTTRTDFGSI